MLCAPTGRAAKRLAETTGRTRPAPSTGCWRLTRGPATSNTTRNIRSRATCSWWTRRRMIDLMLAYQLVRAIPAQAALILVGDVDQLALGGAGLRAARLHRRGCAPRVPAPARLPAGGGQRHRDQRPPRQRGPAAGLSRIKRGGLRISTSSRRRIPAEGVDRLVKMVRQAIPAKFGFDPAERHPGAHPHAARRTRGAATSTSACSRN